MNQLIFKWKKNEEFELNTIEDYKRMAKSTYKAGKGFYSISLRCIDMILSEYNDQVCTNIAFSCELFLKSIIFEKGIDCRKQHDLYQLYNLMSDNDKDAIKKLHKSGNIRKEDFELDLKEIGKAFIVLRYSYERKRMAYNLQFLIELLISLNEYCKEIFENKNII